MGKKEAFSRLIICAISLQEIGFLDMKIYCDIEIIN